MPLCSITSTGLARRAGDLVERTAQQRFVALGVVAAGLEAIEHIAPHGAGHEELEVVGCGLDRAVLLENRLTLFGQPQADAETVLGNRIEEPKGRSRATTRATAATVEEAQRDATRCRHRQELPLCCVNGPRAREWTGVLVAVAVAEHDLLHRSSRAVARSQCQASLHDRHPQVLSEDCGGALEIVQRLEERNHLHRARESLFGCDQQPGLSGEEVRHEQVRGVAGHADDQRPEPSGAVHTPVFGEHAQRRHRELGHWIARRSMSGAEANEAGDVRGGAEAQSNASIARSCASLFCRTSSVTR
jgi:hypothetical protein